jgi:hypothetical protein
MQVPGFLLGLCLFTLKLRVVGFLVRDALEELADSLRQRQNAGRDLGRAISSSIKASLVRT